jgi:glutamate synthase domain-containing protein 3
VVVLGKTGRNFAAGMSGGIAYVFDLDGRFAERCNAEMVDLGPLVGDEERQAVRDLIDRHRGFTGSKVAQRIIARWEEAQRQFIRVMPRDYAKVLARAKVAAESQPAKEHPRPVLKVLHG